MQETYYTKNCPRCGNEFRTTKMIKTYCGIRCRTRAARARERLNDPMAPSFYTRAEPQKEFDGMFLTTLFSPTAVELDALAQQYLNGEKKPSLIKQKMPEGWTPPLGVACDPFMHEGNVVPNTWMML